MERKFIIVIVCLAASLMLGGFALLWKNKDALLASLQAGGQTNRQWIEIKPRTEAGQGQDAADPAPKAGQTKSVQTTKTKTAPKTKAAAKKVSEQVVWCPIPGARAKVPSVIINEVAWMGTANSYADEWIELKNLFREEIDLGSCQLQNKSKSIKINFKPGSRVPSGGFYLLERTDDNAVPVIGADAIYTGNLANTGETLYLFDSFWQIQDSVIAAPAWPAGDNASKRTMERTADLAWRTSIKPGGTPKQGNSVY